MKTAAEQIRELGQRLAQIQEAPEDQGGTTTNFNTGTTTTTTPTGTTTNFGNPAPDASATAPTVDPDKYKPKDKIPEVQGNSLSQAMANARKQGLKAGQKFRWCSVYSTKKGKPSSPVHTNPANPDPFSRYGGGQNLSIPQYGPNAGAGSLGEAVARLRAQLNELAYNQPDPKNPGFMWVPADGTSPLGDGGEPKQMVGTGTGGYVNAKMVPITASKPPEATTPPVTTTPPATTPTTTPEAPPSVTPTEPGKTEQACDPETLAKIKYMPSFNQAFAAARQAGCDQFAWCGVYTVKDEQNPNPSSSEPPAAVGNPNMFFKNVSAWIAQAQRRIGQKPHDAPYSRQEIDAVVKQIKDSGTIEWTGQAERAIRYRMQTGKPMPVLTPDQKLGPNTNYPSTFSKNK